MLGDVLKMVKHAPQRWLTIINTLELVVICLWHVLRKLHSNEEKLFPLEHGRQWAGHRGALLFNANYRQPDLQRAVRGGAGDGRDAHDIWENQVLDAECLRDAPGAPFTLV